MNKIVLDDLNIVESEFDSITYDLVDNESFGIKVLNIDVVKSCDLNLEYRFSDCKLEVCINVLSGIDLVLDKRELVKIRLLPNSLLDTKTAMEEICSGLNADPVQQIGSIVVVYKKSKRKDAKHIL